MSRLGISLLSLTVEDLGDDRRVIGDDGEDTGDEDRVGSGEKVDSRLPEVSQSWVEEGGQGGGGACWRSLKQVCTLSAYDYEKVDVKGPCSSLVCQTD